jgi:hypothetical protein
MCKEGMAKHERKSVRDTRKSVMEVERWREEGEWEGRKRNLILLPI